LSNSGGRFNVLHLSKLPRTMARRNVLRLLRSNGLDQLQDKDLFGEPGTGEYKVKLSTEAAVRKTILRINGENHDGYVIVAKESDNIMWGDIERKKERKVILEWQQEDED
jgi:uncharacterized protein YdbL (DUF1318 family)